MQGHDKMENEKKLWDIGEIEINKKLPVKRKLKNFTEDIGEKSLTHLNGGYVIRVYFSHENYSATDAVKHYLKQIAQLKY